MKTRVVFVLWAALAASAACGPGTTAGPQPPATPASRTLGSAQPASSSIVPDATGR